MLCAIHDSVLTLYKGYMLKSPQLTMFTGAFIFKDKCIVNFSLENDSNSLIQHNMRYNYLVMLHFVFHFAALAHAWSSTLFKQKHSILYYLFLTCLLCMWMDIGLI